MKIVFFSEISKDALADVNKKLASLEQELKELGGKITHCCAIPLAATRGVLQERGPATLLKKRLWHRCSPVNFAKFQRTLFITEHLWWLLLPFQPVFNCSKSKQSV